MSIPARLLLTIWLMLMIVALGIGMRRALAHGWYDGACCSDKDCTRYEAHVAETPKAYVLQDGRHVDMGDPRIRQSLDEHFHVCERLDKSIICLYVPGRGA